MQNPPALTNLFTTLTQALMSNRDVDVNELADLWLGALEEHNTLRAVADDFLTIYNITPDTLHLWEDNPRIHRAAKAALAAQ